MLAGMGAVALVSGTGLAASAATQLGGHASEAGAPRAAASTPPVDVQLMSNGQIIAGPISVHIIYWEPGKVDAKYDAAQKRFLSDLNDTSLMRLLRYYRGPGIGGTPTAAPGPAITVRNSWSDRKTPFPTAHIGTVESKKAFRAEVQHAVKVNGWNTGPGNIFVVYTGPGYQSGATAPLCGEHFAYKDAATGHIVPYAYIPRPGLASGCISGPLLKPINPTPNGSVRIDGAISTTWHELAEMLTDPIPGTGYWDVNLKTEGEIGDLCRQVWPNVTGKDNHNVVLNGHDYLVQAIWSRAAGGCVTKGAPDLSKKWHGFNFGLAPATAVTFTVHDGSHTGTLEVTDAYCQGDRFQVWDNGKKLGPTSFDINVGCPKPNQSSPQKAFSNGGWSAGTYRLPKGPQHISIQVIQNAANSSSGRAFYATSEPWSSGAAPHPASHSRHPAQNGG